MGTTGLGCCIPPCFLVTLATGWERTLICWPWRVVEQVWPGGHGMVLPGG